MTEREAIIVSTDTLKTSDLIAAFRGYLPDDIDINDAERELLERDDWDNYLGPDWDEKDQEVADTLLDHLFNLMDEHAPDGYYFGTSEGDGACFGFWPLEDEEEV